MVRLLTTLLVLLLVALGLGVLVGYLAYGTAPSLSGEVSVNGLTSPVAVGFTDDVPTIEAQTEEDLITGLGYVHAMQSAWPMALWRQTATSRLSTWFDNPTSGTLDRHTLALGFNAVARTTYDALPAEERALLDAYARGVNRAFDRNRLNEGDEFVLFDVRAEPWQPWDALAVERLIAYLATPPLATDSAGTAARRQSLPLRRFIAADSTLRATLHGGDFDQALAFTHRDSSGVALVQRHVLGQAALPLFREAVLRLDGRSTFTASVPGALVFPAGYGDRAWSVFLSGSADLLPTTGEPPTPTFDRIVTRRGDESLVTIYRRGDTLVLFDPDAPEPAPQVVRDSTGAVVDTVAAPAMWTVRWRGFVPGTDLGAWRALLRGAAPTFTLIPGDGLLLDGGGARVLGRPAVVRDLPGGRFAGGHPHTAHIADRLARADEVPLNEDALLSDAYSAWAAELAAPLIALLGGPDEVANDLSEASSYLRSWDYRYRPSSIAASIFDTWMTVYRDRTGSLPDLAAVEAPPPPPDSLGRVPERPIDRELKASLRRALSLLTEEYGEIGTDWRWQNTQRAVRYYPLFGREATATRRRFAPTFLPDGGHPTTLTWGPSPIFPSAEATTSWAARGQVADTHVQIRYRHLYDATYRTRELADPVEPYAVARTATSEPVLRLLPASN